jgi:hypothetical protein
MDKNSLPSKTSLGSRIIIIYFSSCKVGMILQSRVGLEKSSKLVSRLELGTAREPRASGAESSQVFELVGATS